mmetsp:Transcript_68420/g.192969  ORF Transcript_68420/g.192969 Transcript_68420/m.192969 type:complete len:363 (+) Transcript_68420:1517-2605(+)
MRSSFVRGSPSASAGRPSAKYSFLRSASAMASRLVSRATTAAATCMEPRRRTGMPQASHAARTRATKSCSTSSARCSASPLAFTPPLTTTPFDWPSFFSSAKGSLCQTSTLVSLSARSCLPAPTSGGRPLFRYSSRRSSSGIASRRPISRKSSSATSWSVILSSMPLSRQRPKSVARTSRCIKSRRSRRSAAKRAEKLLVWWSSSPPAPLPPCAGAAAPQSSRQSLRSSSNGNCSQTITAVRQRTRSCFSPSASKGNARFRQSARSSATLLASKRSAWSRRPWATTLFGKRPIGMPRSSQVAAASSCSSSGRRWSPRTPRRRSLQTSRNAESGISSQASNSVMRNTRFSLDRFAGGAKPLVL